MINEQRVDLIIQEAVSATLAGNREAAQKCLSEIDRAELLRQAATARAELKGTRSTAPDPERTPRLSPTESRKLSIYRRDAFTCWSCGRRTIYVPVLKALSSAFPDALPYLNNNWCPKKAHAVLWTWSTSWEHRRPVARGGSSVDDGNLINSCYQCNDIRGDWLYADIGWVPKEPVASCWDGGYGTKLNHVPHAGSLVRAAIPHKGGTRSAPFRVDCVSDGAVTLTEMWRSGPQHRWRASKKPKVIPLINVECFELLSDRAPEPGDRDDK